MQPSSCRISDLTGGAGTAFTKPYTMDRRTGFDCVWNGADGWMDGRDYGRGILQPPYPLHMSPTYMAPAALRKPTPPHGASESRTKYSAELRRLIYLAYSGGEVLSRLARRHRIPISSVYTIVTRERQA